jgi:ribosomal-protein-alanine N-acetyltransferase
LAGTRGYFADLETERLLLCRMRLDDAEEMFDYPSDSLVTRYVLWETLRSCNA